MNEFCECMYICFCMEIIILMAEMLLTQEVENISGTVKHYSKKVASQVVTGIMTIENFMFRKLKK
jgi:hypothetical protein